jgi:hypothetical protein
MPADQAAGLRRRRAQQPIRCIHCFFDSAESTTQLAQALYRLGRVSLLVDMRGRLFAGASTRSLFDWKQQLERGQLHMQPLEYGDGWYAPGLQGDHPDLLGVAQAYDHVVFDAGPDGDSLALMSGAAHTILIEVQHTTASLRRAYTLIKTLSHAGCRSSLGLQGNPAACDHVRAACSHFLEPQFTQDVYSVAHEDDAFASLAIRMAGEETRLTTR